MRNLLLFLYIVIYSVSGISFTEVSNLVKSIPAKYLNGDSGIFNSSIEFNMKSQNGIKGDTSYCLGALLKEDSTLYFMTSTSCLSREGTKLGIQYYATAYKIRFNDKIIYESKIKTNIQNVPQNRILLLVIKPSNNIAISGYEHKDKLESVDFNNVEQFDKSLRNGNYKNGYFGVSTSRIEQSSSLEISTFNGFILYYLYMIDSITNLNQLKANPLININKYTAFLQDSYGVLITKLIKKSRSKLYINTAIIKIIPFYGPYIDKNLNSRLVWKQANSVITGFLIRNINSLFAIDSEESIKEINAYDLNIDKSVVVRDLGAPVLSCHIYVNRTVGTQSIKDSDSCKFIGVLVGRDPQNKAALFTLNSTDQEMYILNDNEVLSSLKNFSIQKEIKN